MKLNIFMHFEKVHDIEYIHGFEKSIQSWTKFTGFQKKVHKFKKHSRIWKMLNNLKKYHEFEKVKKFTNLRKQVTEFTINIYDVDIKVHKFGEKSHF